MGSFVIRKLAPDQAVNVVAYTDDLVRRIITVAGTRNLYETKLPAEWGDLFRAEIGRLKG